MIPVHFGGHPCRIRDIMALAERYGVKVIEDAAHAIPTRYGDGRLIGNSGDAICFSFYANKTMTNI